MVWWVWAVVAYWSLLVSVALWAFVERARSALRRTRSAADGAPLDDVSARPHVDAA